MSVPEILVHETMDRIPVWERVPSRGVRSLDAAMSGVEDADSPVSVSLGEHCSKIGTCRRGDTGSGGRGLGFST